MKKQFITDSKGKKISVILPIKEYEEIMEELEEIRLYDQGKLASEPSIPFDEYVKKRKKKND